MVRRAEENGFRFQVSGFEFFRFRVSGFESRVPGSGFRVSCFGFRFFRGPTRARPGACARHTLTVTHSQSHTHSHTLTVTHSQAHTHSHTLTFTHSHSHSHSHEPTRVPVVVQRGKDDPQMNPRHEEGRNLSGLGCRFWGLGCRA